MKKKPYIAIVLGTAREGRQSEKVAHFIFTESKKNKSIVTELFDVRDFLFARTMPPWQEPESKETKKWRAVAKRADAFVIVAPEYNRGYPGELKILLDSAYDEYEGKPVALCGVSGGGFGGSRVVEQLKLIMLGCEMVPIPTALYFSKVGDLFDDKGRIQDVSHKNRVSSLFKDLFMHINKKTK